MHPVNQRNWFDDDELAPCPRCNERLAIVSPDIGAIVCIECGLVAFHSGAVDSQPAGLGSPIPSAS